MVAVCIFSSQVASCCGLHRYKSPVQTLEEMWRRMDAQGYAAAMKRNNRRTREAILHDIAQSDPTLRVTLEAVQHARHATSDETAAFFKNTVERMDTSRLSAEEKSALHEFVRETTYTTYGTQQEDNVFDALKGRYGLDALKDDDFHKATFGWVNNEHAWSIGGKIDGITSDGKVLIEIKNRVNRLFWYVPEYEYVQCQCYLHVLGLDEARLVECFRDEAGVMNTNMYTIKKNTAYFEGLVAKLQVFAEALVRVMSCPRAQDKLLQGRFPQMF